MPGVSQVTFYTGTATTSVTQSVTVASIRRVASTNGTTVTDILLGTLASDVPSSVTSYAIPVGTRSHTGACKTWPAGRGWPTIPTMQSRRTSRSPTPSERSRSTPAPISR